MIVLEQLEDPNIQFIGSETQAMTRAYAVIFQHMRLHGSSCSLSIDPSSPKLYTIIRPLHVLWKSRLGELTQLSSSKGNLREADNNCMAWLDSQPLRSIVHVSFGSYVILTSEELLEI
ncbi:hypothetical protein REPUB_Repub06bG0205500 [Reevesia pubescens]